MEYLIFALIVYNFRCFFRVQQKTGHKDLRKPSYKACCVEFSWGSCSENLNARLLWPLWLRTGLLSSCTKFQCLYVNLFCLFAHTQSANHHKAEMTLAEFIRHAWMLLTAKHYWHVPIHDWQSGPLAVLHGCLMWQCSTHGTDVTLSACRRSLGNFRSLLFFHVIIKIRWLRSQ